MRTYKSMYEQEKERAANAIQEINNRLSHIAQECANWDSKYRQLSSDFDLLKDKYAKVVELNIIYQQDKAKDTAEITRLTKSLNQLREQVDILDPKKHHHEDGIT